VDGPRQVSEPIARQFWHVVGRPDAEPFVWAATADEILAKVRWVETV
jgi:hypothetical protein